MLVVFLHVSEVTMCVNTKILHGTESQDMIFWGIIYVKIYNKFPDLMLITMKLLVVILGTPSLPEL